MSEGKQLVFEIGTEEIPAFALQAATAQERELAIKALDDARIAHGAVKTMSTPRRMTLIVDDLAQESSPLKMKAKGPSVEIAFDASGNPTKAAIGFARGKGVDVSQLERGDEGGHTYVYAVIEQPSVSTDELLPSLLENIITSLSWPRSQRWGTRQERFSRPVRWLLALMGTTVIPVEFAGLTATNRTRGHRLLANTEFTVPEAGAYLDVLKEAKVIPSFEERAQMVRDQIAAYEHQTGYKAEVPEKTFTEVVNLVEYPTVLLGHFEERFLKVPSEIITDSMLSNQRYFPMYTTDGKLTNAFLITSNGKPERADVIIDGNERVVRPRLDDAEFFYDEDRSRPLESYVSELDKVVFQEKLGTLLQKTHRIEHLVDVLSEGTGASKTDIEDARRAATLCKADLVTHAVIEFTSQQGVMGGYYARESGEHEAVAVAIKEHYHPRFAGDILPSNFAGRMVALCDKLDTICGIFAIGQGPTGSKDPYAVRRAAIGVINILLDGLPVSLSQGIDEAISGFKGQISFDETKVRQTVRDFFTTRLEVIAREDRGYDPDAVLAVLASGVIEPTEVMARIDAFEKARTDAPDTFMDLATAYTRAANLTDRKLGCDVDASNLSADDRELLSAVEDAEKGVSAALASSDYPKAIDAMAALRGPIDTFFDKVLIMDKDPEVRANRLKLLNRFVGVFANVADIGKLSKAR